MSSYPALCRAFTIFYLHSAPYECSIRSCNCNLTVRGVIKMSGIFAARAVDFVTRIPRITIKSKVLWPIPVGFTFVFWRVVLSLWVLLNLLALADAEQFSIRCMSYEPYFLTFDTDARRMIFETSAGSAFKGEISEQTPEEFQLTLRRPGQPKLKFIYRTAEQKVTPFPDSGAPPQSWDIHQCVRTSLRPILPSYDRISPVPGDVGYESDQ
jgi:hypothetical protein